MDDLVLPQLHLFGRDAHRDVVVARAAGCGLRGGSSSATSRSFPSVVATTATRSALLEHEQRLRDGRVVAEDERLLLLVVRFDHEGVALLAGALEAALDDEGLQSRPGAGEEVLHVLLVVHHDRRREELHGHGGVADDIFLVLVDAPAALPDADLPQVLDVARDRRVLLDTGDQGVAEDAGVPLSLDRQAAGRRPAGSGTRSACRRSPA